MNTNDQVSLPQGSEAASAGHLAVPPVKDVELNLRPESRLFRHLETDALGIEQYRLLHARLMELQSRAPLKRVLITSAGRGEGKTHVATNLALTMARETDQRVLLVDADIRKPDVHNVYGISNDYGLTDVLRNGHDSWKAVRKVVGTNLYVLTAGSAVSQSLTTSSILTLKMMLDQLNPVFDWMIIDSPPVLVAADSPLLARLVDGVLMVVRGKMTPRDLVEKAKQTIGAKSIVGAVLNGVTRLDSYYNSYYGYTAEQSKNGPKAKNDKNGGLKTK